MPQTFPKSERLTSRKVIDRLFTRDKPGKSGTPPAEKPAADAPLTFYHFPFRLLYCRHDAADVPEQPVTDAATDGQWPQVLFSVPKRVFKKAVDRNAVRRRVREAYRLHKYMLLENSSREVTQASADKPATGPVVPPPIGPVAQIVFLYTAKTKISFEEIEKGMKLALKRVSGSKPR